MLPAVDHISRKAKWYSRRFLITVTGVVLVSIGAGFFVAAAWMLLAAEFSPLIATFACAAFFLGVGMLVLVVSRSEPEPVMPSLNEQLRAHAAKGQTRPPPGEFPALVEAFLFGIATYTRVKNGRR